MQRQTSSTASGRPHGGSQGSGLKRGSDVYVIEEGFSTKARAKITAMVKPRPLDHTQTHRGRFIFTGQQDKSYYRY